MNAETPVMPFLPYGRQVIEEDDIAAVREALMAPLLTTGPLVERFEQALAAATAAREAVVVSNGTAALHLAARAIHLDRAQTAIVPSVTFVATANAVRYCGAEVVFADVDPRPLGEARKVLGDRVVLVGFLCHRQREVPFPRRQPQHHFRRGQQWHRDTTTEGGAVDRDLPVQVE